MRESEILETAEALSREHPNAPDVYRTGLVDMVCALTSIYSRDEVAEVVYYEKP